MPPVDPVEYRESVLFIVITRVRVKYLFTGSGRLRLTDKVGNLHRGTIRQGTVL